MKTKITDTQIRAARELLRWDHDGLPERAEVSLVSVKRIETGIAVSAPMVDRIVAALEAAGVVFLDATTAGGKAIACGVALTASGAPEPRPEPRSYAYAKPAVRPKGVKEARPRKPKPSSS